MTATAAATACHRHPRAPVTLDRHHRTGPSPRL